MNRYGYGTGVAIACITVAAAFYTGSLYGRHTAPEPCIQNMARGSYPVFWNEQEMLDDVVEYPVGSDFYNTGWKTSEDLAYALVEMSQDSDYPTEIYVNERTGRKFYIPGLCFYELDFLGDPILYSRLN